MDNQTPKTTNEAVELNLKKKRRDRAQLELEKLQEASNMCKNPPTEVELDIDCEIYDSDFDDDIGVKNGSSSG